MSVDPIKAHGRDGEIQVHRQTFLISKLDLGEWLNSLLVLTLGKNSGMHRMGGWVGPTNVTDIFKKGKVS